MHGASLTPQKSGDEKKFKKYGQARGEKRKKMGGFHRQNGRQKIVLMNAVIFAFWTFVKNHLIGENCIQNLTKYGFCSFSFYKNQTHRK